jgi:hypothetical protein
VAGDRGGCVVRGYCRDWGRAPQSPSAVTLRPGSHAGDGRVPRDQPRPLQQAAVRRPDITDRRPHHHAEPDVTIAVGDNPTYLVVVRRRVRELFSGYPEPIIIDAMYLTDALAHNAYDHGAGQETARPAASVRPTTLGVTAKVGWPVGFGPPRADCLSSRPRSGKITINCPPGLR